MKPIFFYLTFYLCEGFLPKERDLSRRLWWWGNQILNNWEMRCVISEKG